MDNLMARVALSTIIAVVGGVALMNVSNHPTAIIAWWLLYAIAAGVALAPSPDEKVWLVIAMAAFPAFVPILDAVVMHEVTRQTVLISGASLTVRLAAVVFMINWVGVWLFSYAHHLLLVAIGKAGEETTVLRIKNIEKTVRALALCVAGIALAIAALGLQANL